MPPSNRIPPLLRPYTRLPPRNSLILLSSVLGASANWLVIRFLCDALSGGQSRPVQTPSGAEDGGVETQNSHGEGKDTPGEDAEVAVILVSWMRDWEFWRSEGRKAGGLDLNRLVHDKRFAFVDGLSNLFLPTAEASPQAPTFSPRPIPNAPRTGTLPVRTPRPVAARTPEPPTTPTNPPGASSTAERPAAPPSPPQFKLTSPSLTHLEETISKAITHLNTSAPRVKRILLVLDQPDFLLAAAGSSSSITPPITPTTLHTTLFALRRLVHATLITVSADLPLIKAESNPPVPLETNSAAFVVRLAHVADRVMGCRVLDTGVARDVSGVLRVTVGGRFVGEEDEGEGVEEKELLYHVLGDGSVRVFERGGGGAT